MVNNNGIPFEVKKPFETVYEIKNEIPSFEEFMKTYESDGNLNYDDLSGGGVGEVKGYGPCKRYCGYANPSCTHYLPNFAPLYMSCPACDNTSVSLWKHSGCGGPMYISEYLRLECKDCYTGGHWEEWEFACSKHNGYKTARNPRSFRASVRAGLGLQADNAQLRDLVKRIGKRLIDECW